MSTVKKDVLIRYLPDNEFFQIYIKSGLLKNDATLENCIRLEFVEAKNKSTDILKSHNGLSGLTECKKFISKIKGGKTASETGLYYSVKQSDGKLKNCYLYGYVYGFVQENINLAILMAVTSFDDKAYSITVGNEEYVLKQEWLDKLS